MRAILVLSCFYLCGLWGATMVFAQDDVLQHLLAPGEFSTFHKSISGIKNCSKCHAIGKGISSEKCLTCHKIISTRQAKKDGFHGKIKGECVNCHKEHGKNPIDFTPENFDHRQALFPLAGSHQKTPCEKCHLKTEKQTGQERFTYLDLSTSCKDCHNNPHEQLFSNCSKCHSANTWQQVLFDHNKNGPFTLVGMHQNISCDKCHHDFQNKNRKKLSFTVDTSKQCLSCHKDEHSARLSSECLNCHSMKSWKPTLFNHDKTKFALTGPHQKLSCKACHLDRKISGLPTDCGGCHKKSPHKAHLTPCNDCHSPNNWQQLRDNWQDHRDMHKSFRYPLLGAHLKVACQKCHAPQTSNPVYFNMAFTDCQDCHKDKHQGQLDPPCSRCHTVDSFKRFDLFDHEQAEFKLGELHKSIPCAKCHPNNVYQNTPKGCFRCHMGIARFSRGFYEQITMKLVSPKAKIVDCTGCHETNVKNYKVTETTCIKCHEEAYRQYFVQWRQQFSEQIKAAETDIKALKQCKNSSKFATSETENTIAFLKKYFEHNYRFAAALLKKTEQELSDIRHEFCQD